MQEEPDPSERRGARAAGLELERRHGRVVEEVDDERCRGRAAAPGATPLARRAAWRSRSGPRARSPRRSNATARTSVRTPSSAASTSSTRAGSRAATVIEDAPSARERERARSTGPTGPEDQRVPPRRVEPDVHPEEPFEAGGIGVLSAQALAVADDRVHRMEPSGIVGELVDQLRDRRLVRHGHVRSREPHRRDPAERRGQVQRMHRAAARRPSRAPSRRTPRCGWRATGCARPATR